MKYIAKTIGFWFPCRKPADRALENAMGVHGGPYSRTSTSLPPPFSNYVILLLLQRWGKDNITGINALQWLKWR
ncbi:hypothetical protein LI291_10445 [Intestinibacillus massiliensis]|nr:hypothetical protein [Intestinibacillus massiliensis]